MRDSFVAWAALGVAGIAVATGLTVGAIGGAFDSNSDYVAPPALQSDSSSSTSDVGGSDTTNTSSAITIPPSPSWAVAGPQAPQRPSTTSSVDPSGFTTSIPGSGGFRTMPPTTRNRPTRTPLTTARAGSPATP